MSESKQSMPQTQQPQQTTSQATPSNYRLPTEATFQNAARLAVSEDKPIMMDYWLDSLEKRVLIGVKENGEKMLVKSAEEYTSPIARLYRSTTEYIIITENSIYLTSSDIPNRRIA
jgi:hypothetical protein